MINLVKLIIKYVVFIGGMIVYVYLNYKFLHDIWKADGTAPDLDNDAVKAASAIGGLLAATFAVAFGIQRADRTVDEKKLNLGKTLTPNAELVTALCVAVYFLVGVAALIVTVTHSAETPQEIKTPTALFVGYIGAMFAGIVTGPGKTR